MRSSSLLLLAILGACASPDHDGASPLRVLFLGNSYTEVNDLPAVVAAFGNFETERRTPGGQTWEGHDADPEVDLLIAQGWDYVVLQDQSQQAYVTSEVKDALRSLDAKIHAAGAQTVLFMTWAQRDPEGATPFQQDMSLNYYYAWNAEAIGARVAPVGRAWERALRDPGTVLHAADGSHPDAPGTYLAACVVYATLTGRTPVGLGDGGLAISPEEAARLQEVAWKTILARQPAEPPMLGEWPLARDGAGGDLALATEAISLGDTEGPGAMPFTATQFGPDRYAAIPYFPGMNSANVTVALYASRPDWAAPTEHASRLRVPVQPYEGLVGKWAGYEIYEDGTTLYAAVYTVDDPAPPALEYDVSGLAPGWHAIALTYDGTTYALWIDGTDVVSATTHGDLRYCDCSVGPIIPQGQGIAVGGRATSFTQSISDGFQFQGALAGLRVYDRALTAEEIGALATAAP